jgi:uncharacterized protein (TIGR03083 family)
MTGVPTSLMLDQHIEVLAKSGSALADHAEAAGRDAPVPSCPAWTAAHLVAHQGMVHRWAAAHLRGGDLSNVPLQSQVVNDEPDLIGWFRDGLVDLLEAIADAPHDVKAMVFLRDAPAPRRFWARRQAHETTIHSVDAQAAELGRLPTTEEVGVSTELAVDGIDELVCGFMPRGKKSSLVELAPCTIVIETSDMPQAWTLTVGDGPLQTEPGQADDADATFRGTAAGLYLGLWNRGEDFIVDGRADVLAEWRARQRVTW